MWQPCTFALSLTLVLALALLLHAVVTRPLAAISATMARRADGDRACRAPALGSREMDDLGGGLNSMLDTLDEAARTADENQARLRAMGDASPLGLLVRTSARAPAT